MKLKIEKEEYVKKTFRLRLKLIDKMYKICDLKGITMNKLVEIFIHYSLDNWDAKNG